MNHLYSFCTTVLFLIVSIPAICQTNTVEISGKTSNNNGAAIPYATISIDSLHLGAVCDADGNFILKKVPAGNHKITVSAIGYVSYTVRYNVKTNAQNEIIVKLNESQSQLNDVEIFAKSSAQQVRETPFAVTSIELKEMKNINVDLTAVLNRVPGLRIRENGGIGSDMGITLNGMSSLRIFIDGTPADGFGSSFSFNNFPVNIIERVDVYKGVTPVFLGGDVLAGAINIITKKENTKFLDVSQSYSSFNTHQTAVAARFISKKGVAVNATSFFNHSDNDYPVLLDSVLDRSNPRRPFKVRRPNNGYTSAGLTLEAGVVNKKWADRFMVGGVFSADKKGLQGLTLTSSPIMNAFRRERAFSPTLKYDKYNLFTKGLNVRFSGLYTNVRSESIDTVQTNYYWDGSVDSTTKRTRSFFENNDKTVNTITTLMYHIGNAHNFVLSHNWSNFSRDAYDRYSEEVAAQAEGKISKQISGLSYQLSLLNSRWITTVFAKGYFMHSTIGTESEGYRSTNTFIPGRGIATTFTLGIVQLKTSYEYGVTLPSAEQILGNGSQFSRANLDLKPEESHNINAGLLLNKQWNGHSVMAEGNLFFRDPHNYIRLDPNSGEIITYINQEVVRIRGVEINLRYAYKDLFYTEASGTYQDKRDATLLDDGTKDITYGSRIPNEPYLYGNINMGCFTKLRGKTKWRLGLNWNTAYTEQFPLGFENLGANPKYLPQQLSHDLAVTYSVFSGKYNVSLTGRNITNSLLFDNFSVPKPGRILGIKLRVNLTSK